MANTRRRPPPLPRHEVEAKVSNATDLDNAGNPPPATPPPQVHNVRATLERVGTGWRLVADDGQVFENVLVDEPNPTGLVARRRAWIIESRAARQPRAALNRHPARLAQGLPNRPGSVRTISGGTPGLSRSARRKM